MTHNALAIHRYILRFGLVLVYSYLPLALQLI